MTDADDIPFDAKLPEPRFTPVAIPGLKDEADAVFVIEYAQSGDAILSCIRAGITDAAFPIEILAKRMLERPEILTAVEALRKGKTAGHTPQMSRDSVVGELQDLYGKCVNGNRFSEAIAAKKLQAQIMGWLVERKEITFRRNANDLSDHELEDIIRQNQQEKAKRTATDLVPYEGDE